MLVVIGVSEVVAPDLQVRSLSCQSPRAFSRWPTPAKRNFNRSIAVANISSPQESPVLTGVTMLPRGADEIPEISHTHRTAAPVGQILENLSPPPHVSKMLSSLHSPKQLDASSHVIGHRTGSAEIEKYVSLAQLLRTTSRAGCLAIVGKYIEQRNEPALRAFADEPSFSGRAGWWCFNEALQQERWESAVWIAAWLSAQTLETALDANDDERVRLFMQQVVQRPEAVLCGKLAAARPDLGRELGNCLAAAVVGMALHQWNCRETALSLAKGLPIDIVESALSSIACEECANFVAMICLGDHVSIDEGMQRELIGKFAESEWLCGVVQAILRDLVQAEGDWRSAALVYKALPKADAEHALSMAAPESRDAFLARLVLIDATRSTTLNVGSLGVPVDAVIDLIAAGHLQHVKSVNLSNCDLRTIPPQVFDLPNLSTLGVWNNPDLSLDTFVTALRAGKCAKLERINLAHTGTQTVPPEILGLGTVKELDLSFNKGLSLDRLADAARSGQLQDLRVIDLYGCGLDKVPREIVALPGLECLAWRTENDLAALRDESKRRELWKGLPHVGAQSLPPEIWAQVMTSLTPGERMKFLRTIGAGYEPGMVASLIKALPEKDRARAWPAYLKLERPEPQKQFPAADKLQALLESMATLSAAMTDGSAQAAADYARAHHEAAQLAAALWPQLLPTDVARLAPLLHLALPTTNLSDAAAKDWADLLCAALPHLPPDSGVQLASKMWLLVYPGKHTGLRGQIAQQIETVASTAGGVHARRLRDLLRLEQHGVFLPRSTSVRLRDLGISMQVLAGLLRDGHLQQVTSLDLSSCDLNGISFEVFDFPGLKQLDLSFNKNVSLRALVEAIDAGKCRQLEEIQLAYCDLREVPSSILGLPDLKKLRLSGNGQLSARRSIAAAALDGKLQQLTSLDLAQCGYTTVPTEILALPKLDSLILNVSANDLPRLRQEAGLSAPARLVEALKASSGTHLSLNYQGISPQELAGLLRDGHLQQLTWIDLSSCNLTGIPPEVFDLPGLKQLGLSFNKNVSLRALVEAIDAGKCRQLEEIQLAYCDLREVPSSILGLPDLKKLRLSGNGQLSARRSIAAAALDGKLQQLTSLDLAQCGYTTVPTEILALPKLDSLILNVSANDLPRLRQEAGLS
jgi:Leucine-rich repeat (LRR) protein